MTTESPTWEELADHDIARRLEGKDKGPAISGAIESLVRATIDNDQESIRFARRYLNAAIDYEPPSSSGPTPAPPKATKCPRCESTMDNNTETSWLCQRCGILWEFKRAEPPPNCTCPQVVIKCGKGQVTEEQQRQIADQLCASVERVDPSGALFLSGKHRNDCPVVANLERPPKTEKRNEVLPDEPNVGAIIDAARKVVKWWDTKSFERPEIEKLREVIE